MTEERGAWLSLARSELEVLQAALDHLVASSSPPASPELLADLARRVATQGKSPFPSVRLRFQEVTLVLEGLKGLMASLAAYRRATENLAEAQRSLLHHYFPDLRENPQRAALAAQRAKSLQIKIGLQKRWVRGSKAS